MRRDLPTGTVTFLFTDVEGSTKLLHELGAEGYAEALAEHRRLIREACARHGGVEVDTQGDAFFFAFPTAPGALSAAEAIREGLFNGPIRVRVGLHTGTPLLTEEGYIGDDVHFAARVGTSSHGGQVVFSQATRVLLGETFSLTDLGEHRLKDIDDPVSIYQLGEESFPPLKTISNTNLPRPASSFVGRERELKAVLVRIQEGARLVALTGPGGSGKTRLALEAAASLVPAYKAGVFWVGLASLRDPGLVTETIAQTLGAKNGLAEHIGEREMLLLLDNLEQVIESAPELSSLVSSCPNLTLLVTSRELLRVQGEVEYAVPPLAEPEAVSLFCERAQVEPSDEIAELCARLDSLPLAVELAAARTALFSPEQLLERLSQRLDLLKGGRDSDPRQQTLRATIEWSYDLLSKEEQRLFRLLSVFASGCSYEVAEEVGGAVQDALQSLIDKNLVRRRDSEHGSRYWMLETIREFAREQLEDCRELDEIRQRHAEVFLALAERAEPGLSSSDDGWWLQELELEQDNLRAVLAWLQETNQIDALHDLVVYVWKFWDIRGKRVEGRRWVEIALDRSEADRSVRRAKTLAIAGSFARHASEWDLAEAYQRESVSIYTEAGDTAGAAWALSGLSTLAAELGDYVEAERRLEQAIVQAQEAGAPGLLANLTGNRADLALRQGDDDRAAMLARQTLGLYREIGRSAGIGWSLYLVALCHFRTGQDEDAVRAATESLSLTRSTGDVETVIWLLILLAAVAARREDCEVGATLLGGADGLSERIGLSLTGLEADLRAISAVQLESLGAETFGARIATGRALSLEEAIDYALTSID